MLAELGEHDAAEDAVFMALAGEPEAALPPRLADLLGHVWRERGDPLAAAAACDRLATTHDGDPEFAWLRARAALLAGDEVTAMRLAYEAQKRTADRDRAAELLAPFGLTAAELTARVESWS